MLNQDTLAHESVHDLAPMKYAEGPFLEDALGVLLQPDLAEHPDYHDGWMGMRPRQVCLDQDRPRPRKSIVVTRADHSRLRETLSRPSSYIEREVARALSRALSDAHVVCPSCVSPHVVTMNSTIVCEDVESGRISTLRLVYPHELGTSGQNVSVLQPLGSALLGRRVGEHAPAPWPGQGRLSVRKVPYQPEAAGHLHL